MTSPAFKRFICYSFIGLFLTSGLQAQAALVASDQLAAEVSSQHQRQQLQELLSRTDVENQLVNFGVDPELAKDRVASLTDAEVASMLNQIENLPAGGSALGTIAMVLLILILLDIAGVTDIFPSV